MAKQKELRYLVRVANTDLDGQKTILFALTKIKGIGVTFARAILAKADIAPDAKTGYLEDKQTDRLSQIIEDPIKNGIPSWVCNRQLDYESGDNMHLINADLDFAKQNDIKRMQMTKSFVGLRHAWRLPLRGQRTQSNFRKSKAKASSTAKKGRKVKA